MTQIKTDKRRSKNPRLPAFIRVFANKTAVFPNTSQRLRPFTIQFDRFHPNQSRHILPLNPKRPYSPNTPRRITAVHNSTRPFPPQPTTPHFTTQPKTAVFPPTHHEELRPFPIHPYSLNRTLMTQIKTDKRRFF